MTLARQNTTNTATVAHLHPLHLRDGEFRRTPTQWRLHGSHQMPLKRPYRSPDASRPYLFGDPLAMIDWKAYARTDQLLVREKCDDATARVGILLDCGPAMQWPQAGELPACLAPKLEVATRLALHLAHRHLRAGDQVHVWINTPTPELWHPRTPATVLQAFHHLTQHKFSSDVLMSLVRQKPARLSHAGPRERYDLCYWMSDTLGEDDGFAFLQQGRRRILFHTLSSLEIAPDWMNDGTCYFAEDGTPRKSLATLAREFLGSQLKSRRNLASRVAEWCRTHQTTMEEQAGRYLLVSEQTPLATYLRFVASFTKRL